MDNFANVLRNRQANFGANGGYRQDAMPEVYAYYREYVATGKFPYLRSVVELIKTREDVPPDLDRYLETETYLASQQSRREEAAAYRAKMLSEGWLPLSSDVAAPLNGGRIEVAAEIPGNLASHQVSGVFKVVVANGTPYLLPPRNTRRGYSVGRMENAFYRPVMKGFTISGTPAQVKELTQKLLDTHGNIPVKDLPCLTCPWRFPDTCRQCPSRRANG